MALSTYTELQASVADFLNRDDLSSVIPDFIALAEADMNSRVRHWRMEARATTTFDTQYSALPDNWLETIRVQIGTDRVELIDQATLLNWQQQQGSTPAQPRYFAITNGSLELFPVPETAVTGEMVYYQKIDALGASNPSNWMLADYPDAYLYGALKHSAPYLQEDQRVVLWAGLYEGAIDRINKQSRAAKMGGASLKMRFS